MSVAKPPECEGRIYGCPKCGRKEMLIEEVFDHDCVTDEPKEDDDDRA